MDVIIPTALGASTFTRSTTATYYNSTGVLSTAAINTSRLDYDPVNLTSVTPLIEDTATNNAFSENFLYTGYALQTSRGTTCEYNCITAPDGRYSGDKVVEDFTNAPHYFYVGQVSLPAQNGSYSIFAKAGERTSIELTSTTFSESWRFNLNTGAITGSGTNSTASIKNVGNGWYRCSIQGMDLTVTVGLVNASGNTNYTGDGKSGAYVWGQQGVQTNSISSYIPTPPTFTSRASSAYYINSSGNLALASTNVARQTYNADNLSLSPRLLIEPAATNLCLQSSTFGTTWTVNGPGGITTGQADPTGGTGASLLNDNAPATLIKYSQAITVANNSVGYVFSIFVKKVASATAYPGIELTFTGGSTPLNTSATLNTILGTMTVNSAAGSSPIYTRVDSSNGYWRFSIGLYNNSTGNTTANVAIYPAVNTDASGTWAVATTGNNSTFWGAQLETSNTGIGTFTTANMTRTSHIATTTGAATRSADLFSWAAATRAADTMTTGLFSTNIPENDFPIWSSGTTYGIDVSGSNSVIYKHVKYASLQASNVNHQPDISPTWWSVIGSTNAYAMVDTQVGTQTVATVGGHIVAGISISSAPSISFLNMVADSVVVNIYSNYLLVYTTTLDLTGGSSGVPITDWTLNGLSTYADAYVILDIYAASPRAAACGNLVVGTKYYLGSTETNPTIGIIDYSIKSIDAFGNPTLTKRGYAKRMNTKSLVDNAQVDVVARLMAQVRATPCVWNANTNMNNLNSNLKTSLIIYGYYKDWEIDCDNPYKSYLTLQVEGLI